MIFGRLSKSPFFRAVSLFLVVAFSFCNVASAGAAEDSIGVPEVSRGRIVRPAGELLSPLARVAYTIPLYLKDLDELYMLSETIGAIGGRTLIEATGDSYKDMVGELIKRWLDKVREKVTPAVWEKAVQDWPLLLGAYLKKYEEAAEKVGIKPAEGFRVPESVLTEDALNAISGEFKEIFKGAVARQRRSPGEEAIRISGESDLYESLTPGQAAGLDGVIAGLMMAGMVEIEEIDVTAVGAASGREQTGKNVSRRMEICKLKGFRAAIEEYNRTHEEQIPLDVRVHPGSGQDRWVRMYLDINDSEALTPGQVQRLANHEFYHILNPKKNENEAIAALKDDLRDIRDAFARLERERAREKLLENSRRMAEAAGGGVGPDVVIIVSSSREQAAFWQGRLTGDDGKHGSGAVVKKDAVVLSVSESNWKGGAGNGLGTLNGFARAARKARKLGLIDVPEGATIDMLVDAFLAYCAGRSVFMFHTAGKGTRTAPLPGAEVNSKPNIKLPGMVGLAGGEKKPITILESVLRQTSIYAPSRSGRLSVFWGDQVIVNSSDVDFEGIHHVEIFGQLVSLDESIKSYGVLIPGEGGDCKQREKLPLEEVRKLLPEGSDRVYKSIGSFTISLPFLGAMLEMDDHKEALREGKGSLNTDPDWWQPLTSTRGEYIAMVGKKGVSKEDAGARWDKMHRLWRAFSASQAFSDSGLKGLLGFNDVGRDSLWWDYGQNTYYLRNLLLLTEDSPEGRTARTFFGVESERVKDSDTGVASIEDCIIQNSTIKRGKLKNCVVIDSVLEEVRAENAVIIGSTVIKLDAAGALCYNVVDHAVKLGEGQVLANVFHPEEGRIEMRTHVSRNGSADWKIRVEGNPYAYSEIALLMSGVKMADVEKAKQWAVRQLKAAWRELKKPGRGEEISEKFKPLKFGTSGLRALVTEMTDMECYINTRGFIGFLRERKEINDKNNAIALGGDLRSSTPGIMAAVAKAIKDSGCEPVFCGRVPSPTLAYFAMQRKTPSIMVTGSHIPDDRNGIKFTRKAGEVLKSDEKDILKNVAEARGQEYGKTREETLFDENGMFREKQTLPEAVSGKEATDDYVKRYLNVFPEDALKGKKIVLYQHSAVGRDIVRKIFEGLGAEIICVGRSDEFIPVDTEKISEETRKMLRELAKKHKPFAIISTDGDSDRPLFADENGEFLPGDKLGALVSMFLNPDFAAIPISANDGVVKALKDEGVKVEQTKIGSPYVIAAMNDELNNNPKAKVVSWESNGGFLPGSDWTLGGNTLRALPTRDAVLPLLCALLQARQKEMSVSQLINTLPARYTHADVVDNKTPGCEDYTADMGKVIIKMFSPENSDITQIDFTEGKEKAYNRDGAAVTLNQELAKKLIEIKDKIGKYFTSERGFGEITSINFIDGIRIAFANGDVSHIRPSGNAPEFRNYATANTPERAKEICGKRGEIVAHIVKDLLAEGFKGQSSDRAPPAAGTSCVRPQDQTAHEKFLSSKKPHVLMVTNHGMHRWDLKGGDQDTGGQNVYVNQMTQALVGLGCRVTIVNRGGYKHPTKGDLHRGLVYKDEDRRILYIEDSKKEFARKEDMIEQTSELAEFLKDSLDSEGTKVDLIVSHYWDGAEVAAMLNEKLKNPVKHIWIPHSLGTIKKENEKQDRWGWLRIDERIEHEKDLLKYLDGIGTTSKKITKALIKDYGYEEDLFDLPPCIDAKRFHPIKVPPDHEVWKFLSEQSKRLGGLGLLPEEIRGKTIILEISRTDTTKRKDILIKSFAEARKKHSDILLVVRMDIKKEKNEAGQELIKLIKSLPAETQRHIITLGFVSDDMLPFVYGLTDIYASPSVMEGFGMSVQEAAAVGCSVISSDLIPFAVEFLAAEKGTEKILYRGGKAALIQGKGAIVVPHDDVEGFTLALERLLSDKGLRGRMGVDASRITIENFSWRKVVGALLKKSEIEAGDAPARRIGKAFREGKPGYIRAHNVRKVWGAGEGGIGEYCYGVDSIVVVGEDEALLSEVISFLRREFLGAGVVENFGPMLPLVKILTPAKRLSVQFHDAKNELWIVTGINEKLAGENPSIILGFRKEAVEKYGKKVTEAYGKALKEYGKELNLLIDYFNNWLKREDLLKETGDVVKAAEKYLQDSHDYTVEFKLKKLKEARDKLESFYHYRSVEVWDVIDVPAGTLHAIGPGVQIVEPQIAGPTQALEDGATYPVRYFLKDFPRKGAKKKLDIDRVNEMKPEEARESKLVVIDGEKDSPYMVERLPGGFEIKGLEVHRITLKKGASLKKTGITSSHNLVVVKGKARVIINGKSYDVPMASPGGEMLIIPASAGEYEIVADEEAQIIDTFTPVPEVHDLGVTFLDDEKELFGTGEHSYEETVSICEYPTGVSTFDRVTIIGEMPVPPIIKGRAHVLTVLKGQVRIEKEDGTTEKLAEGARYPVEKGYGNYTIIKTGTENPVVRIDYENTEEENIVYATYDMVKKHINKIQGQTIDLIVPEEMFIKGGANDPGSKAWEENRLQEYVSNKIRIVTYSASLGLEDAANRSIRPGATAILVATKANLNDADKNNQDVQDFLYGGKGKVRVLAIPDIDEEALLCEKGLGLYLNREVVAVALLQAVVTPEQISAKRERNAASDLQKLMGQLTGRAIPRHYLYYMLSRDEMGDALRLLPDHLQKDPLGWLRFLANELLLRMPIKPFNARDELSQRRKLMWSV